MTVKNPKDVFVHLLSNVRQGTERTTKSESNNNVDKCLSPR